MVDFLKVSSASGSASFPASSRVGSSFSPELTVRTTKNKDSLTSTSLGGSPVSSISGENEGPRLRREPTPVDFSRLEVEHSNLKRKFEHLRRDRYKPPDIKESIRRIMRGDKAILELYTDKKDKISLLDSAIETADGNVITEVILYLRNSLCYSLFQEQIMRKPEAASHYLTYLRDHYRWEDLISALLMLGRKEEAVMIEVRQACKKPGPSQKVSALKRLLESGLGSDPSLKQDIEHVSEYYSLLERQQPIENSDDNESRVGKNQKFRMYPKKASLVDQPVLTTLYYCCLYHYELPENSYASPLSMKKHHNLTEKQFCWVAVKALARQKRWGDIQVLLTSKSFYGLGSAKIKSPLPYAKLLDTLERHGASGECLVASKDRIALIEYSSKLTAHTKESYYAQAALQNSIGAGDFEFLASLFRLTNGETD